jgi:exosome complex exonuclease DIS3/RRP44
MLLANISVAEKIYSRFPALSILRRHTPPKPAELEILKEILSKYGYSLNYDTSKTLADSLDQVARPDDKFFNKLIRILTTRCMNEATYFCSADFDSKEFYHYGLAAEFYTHFTSPIRRYADVLVHRLLSAAIDLEPLPHFMSKHLLYCS